jgi:argonaute-like protein implicated in RNA metabolism and viral defense
MFSSVQLKNWIIIYPDDFESVLKDVLSDLQAIGRNMGFTIENPIDTQKIICTGRYDKMIGAKYGNVMDKMKDFDPSFYLCFIPSFNENLYTRIKNKTILEYGIPSQVICCDKIKKRNKSVITNIATQINAKLGGIPWKVDIPFVNTMILGFDVW